MFLQSSVSGLQRLFSTASSLSPHSPRAQRPFESVTEEAHTYDLLYPEGETLRQSQHHTYPLRHGDPASIAAAANSSDDRGGLEIQSPRDVRIIIAQNASALSSQPRIMYDSQPAIPFQQARNGSSPETNENTRPRGGFLTGGLRRNSTVAKSQTAPHSRNSSIAQTTQSIFNAPSSPLSPVSELGGLFGGAKMRSNLRPATSDGETIQSKIAREDREETENMLECMFGAAGFPSVSSTKLHVRPPKQMDAESYFRPSSAREPTSPGAFPKRRTPLTRSTTAADLHSLSTSSVSDHAPQQLPRSNSSSILITRLFSIDPIDPGSAPQSPDGSYSPAKSRPSHSDNLSVGGRDETAASKNKAEQSKSPTYAIAVLLQMPVQKQRPSTPSLGRFAGYSAVSPRSWSLEGPQTLSLLGTDTNANIDYVIAHWTMLMRALFCLETATRYEIGKLLAEIETPLLTRPVNSAPAAFQEGPIAKVKKLKQPTRRALQLSAGALQTRPMIQKLSDMTTKRIAFTLKIRKVVAGQGRWGIWREEARWVGKWAGRKEQNFFLFNLLTAFLGSHTAWLDSLGPSWYRRRHAKQSNDSYGAINSIRHRTVIVSYDKMAARRLIFLLSAFLPGTYVNFQVDECHQSDKSWSNIAYSQSPPSVFPNHRQQSLRRTMNRKTGPNQASPHITSHARSVSFSGAELFSNDDASGDQNTQQRARRASDARSIRNAALPISFNASGSRKNSTTTTATVVSDPAIGVPHFSGYTAARPLGTSAGPRPGSSGSLVSLSLRRTLSRSESNERVPTVSDSHSMSRWGSMISGFWSERRTSSTEESDLLASSEEGLGISGISNDVRGPRVATTLAQMVKEVGMNDDAPLPGQGKNNTTSSSLTATQLHSDDGREPDHASLPKDTDERPFRYPFPLKLSIDEDDGVIDVDLPPTNSYPSSFESIASSPIAMRSAASSFNGRSSLRGRTSMHTSQRSSPEPLADLAGWLQNYHPDFALQAVRPYDTLKEDIKYSMRTEPTPTAASMANNDSNADTDGWEDVCTTLVADTTNFTVTRFCLRRRNPTSIHHQVDALLELKPTDYSEQEEILEEPLMDMDPTLIDAVEKVLAHSGHSSRAPSRAPSRSPSPTRHMDQTPHDGSPDLEVPRSECKKMVLGALEQVAKSVSAELTKGERMAVRQAGRDNVPTDSTLREGVRKWLSQVDREGR